MTTVNRAHLLLSGLVIVLFGATSKRQWSVVAAFLVFLTAAFAIFGMVMPVLAAALAAYFFVNGYIALTAGRPVKRLMA